VIRLDDKEFIMADDRSQKQVDPAMEGPKGAYEDPNPSYQRSYRRGFLTVVAGLAIIFIIVLVVVFAIYR
jgi:hypothetical protein